MCVIVIERHQRVVSGQDKCYGDAEHLSPDAWPRGCTLLTLSDGQAHAGDPEGGCELEHCGRAESDQACGNHTTYKEKFQTGMKQTIGDLFSQVQRS
jgi:hypothetical protein